MEAALLHWLGPYQKEEGLLIPMVDSAARRRMKKLRLASKVNPPKNALRHSYASYWLARSSKEGLDVGIRRRALGQRESLINQRPRNWLLGQKHRVEWRSLIVWSMSNMGPPWAEQVFGPPTSDKTLPQFSSRAWNCQIDVLGEN